MVNPEELNNLPENEDNILEANPEDEKRMKDLQEQGDRELRMEADKARANEPDLEELDKIIKDIKESEIEPNFETQPTKEVIFEILGLDAEKVIVGQEKYDENGVLYRLDFKVGDAEYDYMKAGSFDGSHQSEESYICATTPTTWPEKIWLYENGVWESVK